MNYRHQTPMVWLLIPLIAGIVWRNFFQTQINFVLATSIIFTILFVTLHFLFEKKLQFRNRWIIGAIIYSLFALLSYLHTDLRIRNSYSATPTYPNKNSTLIIRIDSEPQLKKNSIKAFAKILEQPNNSSSEFHGNILCYLHSDSSTQKIKYGDVILIQGKVTEIPKPLNPHEFNYKQYLTYRQIYYQIFIQAGDALPLTTNKGNPIIAYCLSLRQKLMSLMQKNKLSGEELAVGSALVLGYDDDISRDTMNAYANTGALHVLSVSGLHVAIVYIVINYLLSFLNSTQKQKIIKALILLSAIWFYATLTGLSPSVLRSAIMLSFIVVAQSFNRFTNMYNTLAASAFLLLVINPFLLFDIGFQLSYAAVVGIVYFHPMIDKWWSPNSWINTQIWSIISVSLAAQLATLPLGFYYFSRFPNYFLLTNLIVIPISSVILYSGMLLFFVSAIPFVSTACAFVLQKSIVLLNASINLIDQLPYASSDNIFYSMSETICLYLLLLIGSLLFVSKRKVFLFLSLTLIITLKLFSMFQQHDWQKQQKIIVYSVNKHTAIDFFIGRKCFFYADSSFKNDLNSIAFHLRNNRIHAGIQEVVLLHDTCIQNSFLVKGIFYTLNKTILCIPDSNINLNQLNAINQLKVEYLLLSHKLKGKLHKNVFREVLQTGYPGNKKQARALIKYAAVKTHNLKENGAKIIDCN